MTPEEPARVAWPAPVIALAPCPGGLCVLDARRRLCRVTLALAVTACADLRDDGAALAGPDATGRMWLLGGAGELQAFSLAGRGLAARGSITYQPPLGRPVLDLLAVRDHTAVVVDSLQGVLHVFDLAAALPLHRGEYLLQSVPRAVLVHDHVALVAEATGLELIDIADPDRPREAAWLPLAPGPHSVAVSPAGSGEPAAARIALAVGEAGVSLWAWDGGARLWPLDATDTPGLASGVAFAGDAVLAVDRTGITRAVSVPP